LTLSSFAYLRLPLAIAGIGFMLGSVGAFVTARRKLPMGTYLSAAVMMIVFFQAARLAMVKFDPLLSSHELAMAILAGPPGQVIVDHHYYTFSSIAFYTGETELLLNGRWNNFEYGSNAPNVPDVFLDDARLKAIWNGSQRYYLVAKAGEVNRFDQLLGPSNFEIIKTSGGNILMTNQGINSKPGLPGN
jgi:hypothetical protein